MKHIDLFLVYSVIDIITEKSTLVGVFVSYENAVRCRDMLIRKNPDIPCYIVRCKSDKIISYEAISSYTSN